MATLDEMMRGGVVSTGLSKSDDDFRAAFSTGSTQKANVFRSKVEEEPEKLTKWQWISKQLMKPVGAVAAEAENIGHFFSGVKAQLPGKTGLDVVSGKREYSFTDLWLDNAAGAGISKNTAGKIGFVMDMTNDPFNFIGGGLTKLGKLSKKVSSLEKTGKTVEKGSKLAKQISKSGYTASELVLAGSKAEQAATGQRAFLQFAGKTLVKGEDVYKATGALETMMASSRAGTALRHTFSTKTGIKELDKMISGVKNLGDFRKEVVLDKAIKIQDKMMGLKDEEIKLLVEAVENPVARELVKDKKITGLADELEDLFKNMKVSEKEVGVLKGELQDYFPHIKSKESLGKRVNDFFNPKKYSTTLGAAKGRRIQGTVADINEKFGKEFFQSNPVMAYAQRGLASSKAITAKEFLDDVGKKFFVNAEDAPMRFAESTNPLFKGMKAEPEVIRAIDKYMTGIKPDELNVIVRGFDKMQNWWKAQVLISPAYHSRNMFSNFWNNWLAGVKNPILYDKARGIQSNKDLNKVVMTTDAGETMTRGALRAEARRQGVIGKGFYGADIQTALADRLGPIKKRAKEIGGWMPWKQDNVLFKTNRAVGSAIEDNARLANYLHQRQIGMSPEDAARTVKKFLFDYEDLSDTEKNILKRVLPFYTWTRKNIPLQLEQLAMQPEKYAAVPKIINAWEEGIPDPKEEKYMSSYIKDNVPVKMRTNEKGNVEYFLMGNWLPSASAIDFLSQPFENIRNMVTPFVKTPIELWANKSMFFKNTLGEPSKIEYYHKQPTEFVGIEMRKKTAHLMRNIRILNDINKLIKTPAKDEPENSWAVKLADVFFGKAAVYDIEKSKGFFERETTQRESEFKAAIKKAKSLEQEEQAERLIEELKQFTKERR